MILLLMISMISPWFRVLLVLEKLLVSHLVKKFRPFV
jgi:hypothetical protein